MFVVTLPLSAGGEIASYARRAKKSGADILEVRSDLTPVVPVTGRKTSKTVLPILLSLRQDKNKSSSMRARLKEFQALLSCKPFAVDIDIHDPLLPHLRSVWGGEIIVSYHNYDETPTITECRKIAQKMCSVNPLMIKFATATQDYSDYLTHQKLRDFLYKKCIQSTILGMGPKAHLSRLLSPGCNCYTYTYLDGDDAAAPGQVPLSFYEYITRHSSPVITGLLGGPQIASSMSPLLHNSLFSSRVIDAVYALLPTDNLTRDLTVLRRLGVSGFSVTAPHKEKAAQLADVRDARVRTLGVANTLVLHRRKLYAYNTDVDGVILGYPSLATSKRILIYGGGGVIPALIMGIRELNTHADIVILTRHPSELKIKRDPRVNIRAAHDGISDGETFDTLIAAITPDLRLPLPAGSGKGKVAIDLRYGTETMFMADARRKGYTVFDGMSMLVAQGIAQNSLFQDRL